jgi:5-methylcytosine-specific restriction protein B
MLKYVPGENLIKGKLNWSIANYGTIVNKQLLNFFGVSSDTKKDKIKIKYKDSDVECSVFYVRGNTYQLRWDGSIITKDLKQDLGNDKNTFNDNIQNSYVVFERRGGDVHFNYIKDASASNKIDGFLEDFNGEEDIEEALLEMSVVFQEYLKQFLERAKLANPELSQIPVPVELSQISQRLGIFFKTSFGIGTPTHIPWLACFYPGQSAGVEGVYPVILYRKNHHSVTINYGVSADAKPKEGNWPRKWSLDLVKGLPHFPDNKYDESYMYKSFEGSQVDKLEDITDSFIKVISDFISLQNQNPVTPPKTPTPVKPLHGINQKASEDFASVNLRLQQPTVVRYIASLLTKRFVILTGLSGSGKTKLAHAFASWLSQTPDQYRLVAVGADWTSNENVLGFQDALQPTVYRKPVSGALDLILSAENDPTHPYFLILDEMNLSHVERYFADILSAIESGQEIALHSADEKLGSFAGDQLPVPVKIRLPENLFVVGTVNIDETTYMFSPKVLDRANVIEFRATAEDIAGFLDAPGRVDMDTLAGKGAEFGQAFVSAAQLRRSLTDLPAEIFNGTAAAADLKQRLTELFGELAPIGAEFGFRTAFEISSFFYHHAVLTGSGWQFNDALDAQIIQKLMPKLHGSDRKLRPTLTKLKSFCETYTLPLSLAKVDRMLERLTQDGFTSFAEA